MDNGSSQPQPKRRKRVNPEVEARRTLNARIPVAFCAELLDSSESKRAFEELTTSLAAKWKRAFGTGRVGCAFRPGEHPTVDRVLQLVFGRLGLSPLLRTKPGSKHSRHDRQRLQAESPRDESMDTTARRSTTYLSSCTRMERAHVRTIVTKRPCNGSCPWARPVACALTAASNTI